jgi:hypothetical protein
VTDTGAARCWARRTGPLARGWHSGTRARGGWCSSPTLEPRWSFAIGAAVTALTAWGLVEADPLACFLEGVDRDPVRDDPYDPRAVLKALGRARLRRRSLSLVYDGRAGAIELNVSFPTGARQS